MRKRKFFFVFVEGEMDANNPVREGFVSIPIREFRTNVMYR